MNMNKQTTARRLPFKRTWLALLLAGAAFAAQGGPGAPQVVSGTASFTQQGNVFSITNTPNTIINWQSFSIGAGEITRFIQQDANSAVLNRVLGQDPSKILGALQSNGHVFLINPNGIVFGRDARVDVGALTASTLQISDKDFLAGKRNFSAGGKPDARLSNEGAIRTTQGGQVFLLAGDVENSGVIQAPGGQVVLAAGHSVQLVDSGNPDLHVVVSAPSDRAVNLGQVIAAGGKIGIYGALVNQRGRVSADSAVVGANGNVVLRASRDTVLEAGSLTSATGAGKGGEVHVLGERVALAGDARIDASGAAGGGTVLVGGDYQGKNALLPNAKHTVLSKDAAIAADATAGGDGGKVILWSDGATQAHGAISARGAAGGKGGLVETSGHALAIQGVRVDTGAASGKGGTWLLDPDNITISLTGVNTNFYSGSILFADAPLDTVISPADFANIGAGAVLLQANQNINVNAPIAIGGRSLTMTAGKAINVNAAIVSSGNSSMSFEAPSFSLSIGGSLETSGSVDITANNVNLAGAIKPFGTGFKPSVDFITLSGSQQIAIGGGAGDSGSTLGLSEAELLNIDTDSLRIMSAQGGSGGISVVGSLDLSSRLGGSSRLGLYAYNGPIAIDGALNTKGEVNLYSGSSLSQSAPITASQLYASGTSVSLGANNAVGILAGSATAGSFTFKNAKDLILGIVGDNTEVFADGGSVNLSANGVLNLNSVPRAVGGSMTLSGQAITGTSYVDPIIADSLSLNSSNGIGGANPLWTQVSTLYLNNSGVSAPISVENYGFLNLVQAQQLGANNTGSISVVSHGGMSVGNVSAQGDIMLKTFSPMTIKGPVASTGGFIEVEAASGAMTIDATGSLSTQGGAIKVTGATIANAGLIGSATGDITLLGAYSGAGKVTTGGKVTGYVAPPVPPQPPAVIEPTVAACLGGSTDALCKQVLAAALDACVADPAGASCSQLLPSLNSCIATPGQYGCSVVLPAIASCIANPATAGCSAVLPTLTQCVANPSLAGCSVILPSLASCIASPAKAGCGAVLPSLALCTSAPSTPGCAVVLPTLAACIATPGAAGCTAVLPTLASCIAAPATAGCSVVLPNRASCDADPTQPGCSALPPTLAQCIATPTLAGCAGVLPTIAQCTGAPATAGCQVVLPSLAACTVTPTTAGCSVVLPSLAICTATPATAGCSAVLPKLAVCIAAPAAAGCTAVLPTLTACIAAPLTAGCTVVLPSLATCIATPAAAGCSVVLPSLAICVTAPATAGCSVVLPTLALCTATPSMAGCAVVLPPVQTCANNPTLPGCTVVTLPPAADICTIAPNSALCQVLSPPTASEPVKPVQQASNEIIKTVVSLAPKYDPTAFIFNDPKNDVVTSTGSGGGGGGGASGSVVEEIKPVDKKADAKKADDKKDQQETAMDKSGAKNEPVKKLYCN
jgi:filamentous hemagglutinin family protein